ncbi:hypothetical protein N2605_26190 [Bradyrhizobium yuanmingense]|uniref:hypothetical protein n=1 Tax=Bradyrhizobium yuanmingense TaxID=108015 RepID=UPI0021A5FC37|nr:hypothetical protein [Bradyrhizobium sp. CB1024]UWU83039.1 hypothetical protein N2605_26190 [Bradyrhizobium sp. CB1024]
MRLMPEDAQNSAKDNQARERVILSVIMRPALIARRIAMGAWATRIALTRRCLSRHGRAEPGADRRQPPEVTLAAATMKEWWEGPESGLDG